MRRWKNYSGDSTHRAGIQLTWDESTHLPRDPDLLDHTSKRPKFENDQLAYIGEEFCDKSLQSKTIFVFPRLELQILVDSTVVTPRALRVLIPTDYLNILMLISTGIVEMSINGIGAGGRGHGGGGGCSMFSAGTSALPAGGANELVQEYPSLRFRGHRWSLRRGSTWSTRPAWSKSFVPDGILREQRLLKCPEKPQSHQTFELYIVPLHWHGRKYTIPSLS